MFTCLCYDELLTMRMWKRKNVWKAFLCVSKKKKKWKAKKLTQNNNNENMFINLYFHVCSYCNKSVIMFSIDTFKSVYCTLCMYTLKVYKLFWYKSRFDCWWVLLLFIAFQYNTERILLLWQKCFKVHFSLRSLSLSSAGFVEINK